MSTQAINPPQSCKCPCCGQWKSSKDELHGHLLSQHKINPPFHVKGNGEKALRARATQATSRRMRMTTYRAEPCGCHHPNCEDWHVSPIANVQCVSFTERQARNVAELLNQMERFPDRMVHIEMRVP